MIVYGEVLVAENFIIGGVLLFITAEIHGEALTSRKKVLKWIGGSLMCGAFSLVMFLPVRMPVTVLMEAVFALAVCFLMFGGKKLWQKALTFVLVTYFMGGITMGLLLLTNHTGIYTAVGIYTGDMKAGLLALFTAMTLFTARKIIRTVEEKKFYQEHMYRVRIAQGTVSVEAEAFLDTGNQLTDPLSGRPVAVAGRLLWERMQKEGLLRDERFRLIPYETIGGKGLLKAVRVDDLEFAGRHIRECFIARGDGVFSIVEKEGAVCELLLSKEMIDRRI